MAQNSLRFGPLADHAHVINAVCWRAVKKLLTHSLTHCSSTNVCIDVKNVSDVSGIRAYQDAVLEAFTSHSADHYPAVVSRATRLLATLAELTRVSVVARETLAPYQASGRVPQHSLLHELLKGDAELHWEWWWIGDVELCRARYRFCNVPRSSVGKTCQKTRDSYTYTPFLKFSRLIRQVMRSPATSWHAILMDSSCKIQNGCWQLWNGQYFNFHWYDILISIPLLIDNSVSRR